MSERKRANALADALSKWSRLTVEEAAGQLGISEEAVERLASQGRVASGTEEDGERWFDAADVSRLRAEGLLKTVLATACVTQRPELGEAIEALVALQYQRGKESGGREIAEAVLAAEVRAREAHAAVS
jgi:hypothetical protein